MGRRTHHPRRNPCCLQHHFCSLGGNGAAAAVDAAAAAAVGAPASLAGDTEVRLELKLKKGQYYGDLLSPEEH